jgi:uncharacterized protein (TIGR02301 family)
LRENSQCAFSRTLHGTLAARAIGNLCSTQMLGIRVSVVFLVALGLAAPAQAQFWGSPFAQPPRATRPPSSPAPKPPPQASAPASPQLQDQPAPYDRDLQRLSEILGALHFLRGICNSNEGQKWRSEAQALIDIEAPSGNRREQMVASFNRGYRGFQQTYHSCTPAADLVIRRYLDEGAKIARDITARYAN